MKCGYFDQEKREYVIDRIDVPVSWTNYLGVEDLRAVANHTAGGYLFYKSPEHHRIIRFRPNGVPMDRPGHYIYLRDDETGEYWSVSWQPCGGAPEDYRCRHGLSYSVYECSGHGVRAAQTLFIPRGENMELWDLSLENAGDRSRSLSVYSYAEFSYHQIPIDNQNFQMSLYCAGSHYEDGVIDYELFYEHAHQFMAASFIEVGGRTGLGYRDTAQDAMTIPHSNPEMCRKRILQLLQGLTSQGYGLHLFDPAWFEPQPEKSAYKSPTVIPAPDKAGIVHGLRADWNDCLNLGGRGERHGALPPCVGSGLFYRRRPDPGPDRGRRPLSGHEAGRYQYLRKGAVGRGLVPPGHHRRRAEDRHARGRGGPGPPGEQRVGGALRRGGQGVGHKGHGRGGPLPLYRLRPAA